MRQRTFEATVKQHDEGEETWHSTIEIGAKDHIDALIALHNEYPADAGYTISPVKEITHA